MELYCNNPCPIDELDRRAKLEQVAEECGELGQACMKLVRAEGNGNPCRMTKEEALDQVVEEVGDLLLAVDCMLYDLNDEYYETDMDIFERIQAVYNEKTDRWIEELKKAHDDCKTEVEKEE